jgi:hypothetical protein
MTVCERDVQKPAVKPISLNMYTLIKSCSNDTIMVKTFPKFVLLGESVTQGAFGLDGYRTAMLSDVSSRIQRWSSSLLT